MAGSRRGGRVLREADFEPGRVDSEVAGLLAWLHVGARLTRGGRRLRLRISATWPWRHELATAFHRLAELPRPVG
jgi:hypothetical protein